MNWVQKSSIPAVIAMLKLITIPAQGTRFLARAIMFRTLANLYSHGYKYFFADSWKVKPVLSASKPAPDGSLTSDFPVWNMSFRYFFDWCYMFTSITNLENCLPRACITITCTPWRVVFKSLNSPLLRENLLTFPVCVIRNKFIRKLSHLTISSSFILINQKNA